MVRDRDDMERAARFAALGKCWVSATSRNAGSQFQTDASNRVCIVPNHVSLTKLGAPWTRASIIVGTYKKDARRGLFFRFSYSRPDSVVEALFMHDRASLPPGG